MKPPHLRLVPPPAETTVTDPAAPRPWWEATEFLALAEVRQAMTGGEIPTRPPRTAEESARYALFWVLYESEHIIRELAKRIEAGEQVLLGHAVHVHQTGQVDFNLRFVERVEVVGPGDGR